MIEPRKKHLINYCVVIAGLLTIAWNRSIHAALPPASTTPQSQESETNAPAESGNPPDESVPRERGSVTRSILAIPPIRIGGKISYELRSDATEGQKIVQQGISSTLIARTNTYLWQPWFATLSGELGMSALRYRTVSTETNPNFNAGTESLTSKNLVTTGNLQLNLIPRSKYPFEAHFMKTDSRIGGTLSALTGYSSMNFGMSQNFVSPMGTGQIGLDRNEQTSTTGGESRQDNLRLSLSKALTLRQNLQVEGAHSDNTLKTTGERAMQTNLSLQHKFSAGPEFNLDSAANLSKSDYRLAQGSNDTDLLQMSSFGFWRPNEGGVMITGGVRLLSLENSSSNGPVAYSSNGSRMSNANVNVGINYDYSRTVRMNASANVNTTSGFGQRAVESMQAFGATYQPETKKLGAFNYNWSTGANVTNIRSSGNSQQQGLDLKLQLSQSLGRSVLLGSGSVLSMSGSQSLSSTVGGRGGQQLTHTGSLSWNRAMQEGSTYVSLSASDSRTMDDQNESFQMVNSQISSSIPTGRFSAWSGNLTTQAVRQHSNMSADGVVTTSSGSISYQNQRLFGVRRLRFLSDLRLNSEELLPILGGPQNQETAAWENTLDYSIGRTQFRMSARLGKSAGMNIKSIMFTVTRRLGDF